MKSYFMRKIGIHSTERKHRTGYLPLISERGAIASAESLLSLFHKYQYCAENTMHAEDFRLF